MKIRHEDLIDIIETVEGQPPSSWTGETDLPDCSCGCAFFLQLEGTLGYDWGVCCNKDSQRCGMLTFEHQGCEMFTRLG